ncbi:Endogenous retrovirus group V member 2 Env polyprotein, partial [Eudyptes sclateri]
TGFHSFVRWIFPWLGVSKLEKAILNVSATMELALNATGDALLSQQREIESFRQFSAQNRMALDVLFASQGGIYAVINGSCC